VLKIAVCSQNRKTVTEHAGKCRKFWIYDVMQGQVLGKVLLELPVEQSLHASAAAQTHPLDEVSVLISGGMGSGLQQRLLQRGIHAIVTTETDPDHAVGVYLAGEIERLPPNRAWVAPCSHEDNNVPVCATAPR
jgi:predicted Fe-Mo cluster-binding NifX family protein